MERQNKIIKMIGMLKSISQFINDTRSRLCEPYGLTPIQAIIVLDVYHHPGCTKVTDICKRLNKSTNTISPLVLRLMEKDYLYKKQNPMDGRVYDVYLTEFSKKMLVNINKDVLSFAEPMFNQLTDEEFTLLFESLEMIEKVCELQ